ncbi:MAG: N-acetylglucosamine-6-phosphate deacetylase [Clostridia bacterium]|nr:N-acetylglucosamine-6-phosphate deacetylase [Clostridia bacterium]
MLLKNGQIFYNGKFQSGNLLITDGKITDVDFEGKYNSTDGVDCTDKYIFPTLVDIHTHGCIGCDFSYADVDKICKMREYYLKNGIGAILPTTVSLSDDDVTNAVSAIKTSAQYDCAGADIAGINLEGPYLSPKKCGAHDISLLKGPDINFINSLGDIVKIVNVAPEYPDAFDFIKKFKGKTSIAHTDCDYNTAIDAINLGADHITHVFNAMNGLNHRNPGVIGAFFDTDAYAEIICDGIHIHESVLRMMFSAKGENLVIISDSMSATGLDNGNYKLGMLDVTVKDGKAFLSDGTLAGSVMNVYSMMKNLISIGVKKETAVASATEIPAKSIGIDDKYGKIEAGRCADIVIADNNFNIDTVIHKGEVLTNSLI